MISRPSTTPLVTRSQPFLVTISLDPHTQSTLNALRRAHFPPHRNYLDAHLTLFHALPPEALGQLKADLKHLSEKVSPYEVEIGPLFLMGNRGVGIHVGAPTTKKQRGGKTQGLHERLLKRWLSTGLELSNQDRQGLTRPHVTIQNKVTEEDARATFEKVEKDWKSWTGTATAFELWEYQKSGHWVHEETFLFTCPPSGT